MIWPATTTRVSSLLLLLALCCGCQSFATPQASLEAPAPGTDTVTVQVRPASRKAITSQMPLKPNMRLQDVVNNCQAKFRRKQAYIVRVSPKTGERHKLEANFTGTSRVTLETDYAIQPGDRIVIAQDTTTSFDRVLQSLLGRS